MTEKTPAQVWLDSIEIANPCPADWNEMSGDDRQRHCRLCKLNVYNISEMTAEQARTFLIARTSQCARTCIRLMRRPDGTVITRDCSRARRQVARARWALASGIGLALLFATQGWAAVTASRPVPADAPIDFNGRRAGWIGPDEIQALRASRAGSLPPVAKAVNWIQSEYSRTRHDGRAVMGDVAWGTYP